MQKLIVIIETHWLLFQVAGKSTFSIKKPVQREDSVNWIVFQLYMLMRKID